jgi:predicted TIM-barrel enzyme
MAIEKGAQAVLMPVTSRRQLFDLSDDMATKVDTQFYQDARDALLKALVDCPGGPIVYPSSRIIQPNMDTAE